MCIRDRYKSMCISVCVLERAVLRDYSYTRMKTQFNVGLLLRQPFAHQLEELLSRTRIALVPISLKVCDHLVDLFVGELLPQIPHHFLEILEPNLAGLLSVKLPKCQLHVLWAVVLALRRQSAVPEGRHHLLDQKIHVLAEV
eukprot:TRINITY_DN3927_c0_g1_i1.p1 TRINITY_DN3927_c0_g1~~TRINITY_DN3927_c0_g1_i1.p1  ORF type:complete len:142 (+),score=6.79 TRINITY_DN3927_c0_g1_i1:171-596(+)